MYVSNSPKKIYIINPTAQGRKIKRKQKEEGKKISPNSSFFSLFTIFQVIKFLLNFQLLLYYYEFVFITSFIIRHDDNRKILSKKKPPACIKYEKNPINITRLIHVIIVLSKFFRFLYNFG